MTLLERTTDAAARVVDAAGPGPVLVFGSLPGLGRDLDLLVRDAELPTLRDALADAGFRSRDDEWVRFQDGTVEAVDLVAGSTWKLPADELDRLFSDARPVPGFGALVRPSPADALLVIARVTGRRGQLPDKRALRIAAALAEDDAAWRRARRLAPAWHLESEVERLERLFDGRAQPRPRLPRPSRPRVIALSGVDGSGKSSQAALLEETLARLGFEPAVEWTPFGQNRWLDHVAVPVKRLLGRSGRFEDTSARRATGLERTTGTVLRERNAVVNHVWATVVALANALTQLRTIVRHTGHGRVVVYDRYVLDSVVQLRFRYGAGNRFGVQRFLLRLMAPKPLAAFYLAVPAETSLARKDDRWTPGDLETQALLYEEEWERHGAVRLDGRRPREELAAEIAEAVWRRLG